MRSDMISTGPLVRAIEARGGVEAVARKQYLEQRITRGRMVRIAAWYKDRAPKGYGNVFAVDAACIDLLGMHPCLIYGEEWWEPGVSKAEPITLARHDGVELEEAA